MKCDCVERLVSRAFGHLGSRVSRNPKTFIVIPVLLSVMLTSGVFRLSYTKDVEHLYTPVDGPAKQERWVVENLFPMNFSKSAHLSRVTRIPAGTQIFIEANDGKSIFDKDVFAELKKLDRMVRNVTVVWDGKERTYTDLCGKSNKKCLTNEVLDFEDRLDNMANGKYSIQYPLHTMNELDFRIFFGAAVLGAVKTNENSLIKSARAVRFIYILDKNTVPVEIVAKWEYAFLKMIGGIELKHLSVGYIISNSFADELEKSILSALPLFVVVVSVMIAFSVSTCLMMDWVRSKPWLGICGCFSSCISVVAGFGVAMLCGIPFTALTLAAPFLVLGIGMDNTFVLLAAWRKTDYKLSVEERLSKAYSEAAVSITITSLTNFVSFMVGLISPFVCVKVFCWYTGLCILFTYIYQVTLFGGCMAIAGRAEKKNLHGMLCTKAMPKSLSKDRSVWYRLFCTGGNNPDDPDNPMDRGENFLMVFCRDQLGKFLNNRIVKFAVIATFIAYLTIGLWSCTNVNEGLELANMARYDSYTVNFYKLERKYFRMYPHRIQVIINRTLDYSDPRVQDEVEDVLQKLENAPFMSGPRFTESWLRIYKLFINDPRTSNFFHGLNMSKKADFYEGIKRTFFKLSKNYFESDIKFNYDHSEITATRFIIQNHNVRDTNDEKKLLASLREFKMNSSLPITTFHFLFVYFDIYMIIKDVAVQTVCVATAVMMFITFVFIPMPTCAIWVAFSILSIEIGVVGYVSMWGVNLDMISTLNLILCIGFSVDFSAHISYAYMSSDAKDPKEKLKKALHSLGLPILQGSISTMIGMSVLALAPSYICHVFAKSVFLVVVFGAIHGLFLLPVLLSLSDQWREGNASNDDGGGEQADCPPPYCPRHPGIDKVSPPSYWTLPVGHLSTIQELSTNLPASSDVQSNGHVVHEEKETKGHNNPKNGLANHSTDQLDSIENRNHDDNGGKGGGVVPSTSFRDCAEFFNPAFEE